MKRPAIVLFLSALFVCGGLMTARVDAQSSASPLISEAKANQHGLTRAWFLQAQVNPARGRIQDMLLHEGTLFLQSDRGALQAMNAELAQGPAAEEVKPWVERMRWGASRRAGAQETDAPKPVKQSLWSTQVGSPDLLPQPMSANSNVVATVNGSTIYVLNRHTGKVLWIRDVGDAIGAGCALSEDFVFAPSVKGRMYAFPLSQESLPAMRVPPSGEELEQLKIDRYRLEQKPVTPLAAQAFGRSLIQPVIARHGLGEDIITWVTDRGYLFIGAIDYGREAELKIRHKVGMAPKTMFFDHRHASGQEFSTATTIAAQQTHIPADPSNPRAPSLTFVAATLGVVFAVDDLEGRVAWQFSTGERIDERIGAIGDRVYIPLQPGGMYCLDAFTGEEIWYTPGIDRFIAASEHRIYALDTLNRLVALDAASGALIDTILDASPYKIIYTNLENDRIYLATAEGLVQCLHEQELDAPIKHRPSLAEIREMQAKTGEKFGGSAAGTPAVGSTEPAATGDVDSVFGNSNNSAPFGGSDDAGVFGAFGGSDSSTPPANDDSPFGGGDAFGGSDDSGTSSGGGSPTPSPFGDSPFGDSPFGG